MSSYQLSLSSYMKWLNNYRGYILEIVGPVTKRILKEQKEETEEYEYL
jgi:hypothetical protein